MHKKHKKQVWPEEGVIINSEGKHGLNIIFMQLFCVLLIQHDKHFQTLFPIVELE